MKRLLSLCAGIGMVVLLVLLNRTTLGKPEAPPVKVFPHKYHVEEVALECAHCHASVATSTSGLERLLPDRSVCAECHDDVAEVWPETRPQAGASYAAFSHQAHTEAADCQTCHAVQAGREPSGAPWPNMRSCYDCHQTKRVNLTCAQCHQGELPAKPASHRFDWTANHGEAATFDPVDCAMCHQQQAQDDCATCHQGAGFGSPHPQKFVHSKAFTRAGGFANCQSCHEPESFCSACHMQKMVLPSDHSRPGWAKTGSGGAHVRKAQSDFDQCVICHTSTVKQPSCFAAGCHQ
ncbi:MAG: cytochrome c3 family protein [Calditrichaeota bacterium]|nr:cytochrome c3 family protein [Calditrichota bacterium]